MKKNKIDLFKKKMKQNKHKDSIDIFRHLGNFFSASIFTKFIAFLSLPIFTRLLGPEGYGGVSLYLSIVGIVSIISSLGIDTSIRRYYFEEDKNLVRFFKSNLFFLIMFQIIFIGFILIFSKQISYLTNIPIIIILLGSITGILHSYKNIALAYFQVKGLSHWVRNIALFSGISVLIVSILLVIIMGDYFGKVYGTLIGAFLVNLILVWKVSPIKKIIEDKHFEAKLVKYSLFLGCPIVLNQLAGYVLAFFDRLAINKYYGLNDAGLYSFAYGVGMIIEVVIYSINAAWVPILFKKLKNNDISKIQNYFKLFSKIVLFASANIILFSRELLLLLADKRFSDALIFIPIIVIGYMFKYLYTLYSNIEYYYKKTKMLAFFSIVAAVINIILNVIFIPWFGSIAAAYTTLFSYILLFIMHYTYVKLKLNKSIYKLKYFGKTLIYFIIILSVYYLINTLTFSLILSFIIKLVLILILLGIYAREFYIRKSII